MLLKKLIRFPEKELLILKMSPFTPFWKRVRALENSGRGFNEEDERSL